MDGNTNRSAPRPHSDRHGREGAVAIVFRSSWSGQCMWVSLAVYQDDARHRAHVIYRGRYGARRAIRS